MDIGKDKIEHKEHVENDTAFIKDIPMPPLPTEKEMAAANLRYLMHKLDGDDKCAACHAAKLLEQKDSSTFHNDGTWAVLIFLIIFGWTGSNSQQFSSEFLDVYLKYLQDKDKSTTESTEQSTTD